MLDRNEQFQVTVRELPIREQIDIPVREQLIVGSTRSSRGTDARHPTTHCRSHRRGGGKPPALRRRALEPGFGHTIGNSLRRTLLSSIPGAAVTQVRFDDALHEFDTIEVVAQDVTDIILNLKDLVLVVHSDEPVTLRLDARGAAEVTAADIQPHPDVEVLNGDLEIASLNGKGRLAVDLTVQGGRGYVSADKNKTGTTIGVIPVDSIYSPVRRVSFEVEPTRVEQSTDYDLVLEIETDGSVSPREALASAGDTLRALVQLVEEMSDEPQGLGLGEAVQVASGGGHGTPHRRPRTLRASSQLPQRPGQHGRRAAAEERGRPSGHH